MANVERGTPLRVEVKKHLDAEERREIEDWIDDLAARMAVASFGSAQDAWNEGEMRFVVEQAYKMAHAFVAVRERRRA